MDEFPLGLTLDDLGTPSEPTCRPGQYSFGPSSAFLISNREGLEIRYRQLNSTRGLKKTFGFVPTKFFASTTASPRFLEYFSLSFVYTVSW